MLMHMHGFDHRKLVLSFILLLFSWVFFMEGFCRCFLGKRLDFTIVLAIGKIASTNEAKAAR